MLWVKTADNAPWDYNDTILSFNQGGTRFALNNCPYLDYHINSTATAGDTRAKAELRQTIREQGAQIAYEELRFE